MPGPPRAHPYRQAPSPPPVDPKAPFAGVTTLGRLKSEHAWVKRDKAVVTGLIGLTVGLYALSAGLSKLVELSRGGDATPEGALFALTCGLAFGGLAARRLWRTWRNWHTAAALFEGGFAYHDRTGLKVIRWDDIDSIDQSIIRPSKSQFAASAETEHRYAVYLRDGTQIVLDDQLCDVASIGDTVVVKTVSIRITRQARRR